MTFHTFPTARDFLDHHKIHYTYLVHDAAYTTSEQAHNTHISGYSMAKSVVMKIDDKFALVVVRSIDDVDVERVKKAAKSLVVQLATEEEFKFLFPTPGGQSPLGPMYSLPVYLDEELVKLEKFYFKGNTFYETIGMDTKEYLKLAKPVIGVFADPVASHSRETCSFLDKHHVKYSVIKHSKAITAAEVAKSAHIPGRMFAKTVIIKGDNGGMAMAVLRATDMVDMDKLFQVTDWANLYLAPEDVFNKKFENIEHGAMPPLGPMYDLAVYMDSTLAGEEEIYFNSGSHSEVIHMSAKDYKEIVKPVIAPFRSVDTEDRPPYTSHDIKKYLDDEKVRYVSIKHGYAYTSQEIAHSAHVSGKELAKTVMVMLDGKLAMAVLRGSDRINMTKLGGVVAKYCTDLKLADERQFKNFFPNIEPGAMPPLGNLWGLQVFLDKRLGEDDLIYFNAGTHKELIELHFSDYSRLASPIQGDFAIENALGPKSSLDELSVDYF